jgi:uncharacterized SAM-binding protein YcdF (DUF218 family)
LDQEVIREQYRRWGNVIGGALILLGAITLVAWPRVDPIPESRPELIVVLSSGVARDSTLDWQGWSRLLEGIALAKKLDRPLATTRIRRRNTGPTNDYMVGQVVTRAGLTDRWTMTDSVVRNTRDEAVRIREMFPQISRVAVVTSPQHTRRACATFEQIGFTVTCRASRKADWWALVYLQLYELAAVTKYKLLGWL